MFLAYSNRMKGVLSGLKTAIKDDKFDGLEAGDEQLTLAKNFGIIYAYWNVQEIWNSFCDSYNGMRDILDRFDQDWILNNPNNPSNLRDQWGSFVREELAKLAMNGRTQAMSMFNSKKAVGGFWGFWWEAKWWYVFKAPIVNQYSYIKLDKSCRNLQ